MGKLLAHLKIASLHELILVWKVNGKLKFIDFGGYQKRNDSMKKLLKEALKNNKDFGFVIINTSDRPISRFNLINIFSFSEADGFCDKVIPDFIFDKWEQHKIGGYDEITHEIMCAGKSKWEKNMIGWIGNFNNSKSRILLADLAKKYPIHFDIKNSMDPNTKRMSLGDLVKTYSCLIDVEGYGYSGRTKLLLFSGRPLFIQERKWIDYPLKYAVPGKHYVSVKNDFSDLEEKFEDYLMNPEKYLKIGKEGQIFAEKKLSRDAALDEIKQQFANLKFSLFNPLYIRLFIIYRIFYKIFVVFYILFEGLWKRMWK